MQARKIALVSLVTFLGASASGQVLNDATFEDGDNQGWYVNGNQMVFEGGNPGQYMGVPFMSFWGVHLSNGEDADLIGDLTRHGGPIEVSVDVNVLNLINFFEEPVDSTAFPLVLQITDTDTNNPGGPVSVYYIGEGLPVQGTGWHRYTFTIPDPTSLTLPPGWGGTGDEDPQTFEPILPANRTYRSVLENVAEIRITTFQPGYFYTSNFWEVGFDNVRVDVGGEGCLVDWDSSGGVNSSDISAFLSAWLASVQMGDLGADFNVDGSVNSNDISAFLTAWLDAVQNGC